MILVSLALANICFNHQCYPVLVGKNTPRGIFQLKQVSTKQSGYGGDILKFKETSTNIFAIHRVLDISNRLERIKSPNKNNRISVTMGCINIDPKIYDNLVSCCINQKLKIK